MQAKRIYTINSSKLDSAYLEGFYRSQEVLVSDTANRRSRIVIFNRFCSYERATKWGRFHCNADLALNGTIKIYALASDGERDKAAQLNDFFHSADIAWSEKKMYFENNGLIFTNHKDVLLYEAQGEYLWIAVEVYGDGITRLYDMRLDSQGDNFMQTFPEIYQEEGGFFHRYMSIFSSIYQDMSDKLDRLDKYLDVDNTPIAALTEIAGWLGFEARENFLDESMLRKFVKQIYHLNRIKGTKEVMQEIIEVVLGDEAVVMERNKMEKHIPSATKEVYKKLYGDTIYDVVILVKHREDEKLQAQMMVILDEFKPVRSRLKLVFAERSYNLDSYCYLDFNASLDHKGDAYIDGGNKMNGMVMLQ